MAERKFVAINKKRAIAVFSALVEAWKNKHIAFKGAVLPEDRYPLPKDPRQAAHFLFYNSIPMRGAVNSDDPFKLLDELFRRFPEAFDPKEVVKSWDAKRLLSAFAETSSVMLGDKSTGQKGLGAMGIRGEDHVASWIKNSQVIVDYWGGDVRNIFDGVQEFEQAFALVDHKRNNGRGIVGMRRKIFSLFTSFLMKFELVHKFPFPIPVDFHALRALRATGVVRYLESKPFEPTGRPGMEAWRGERSVRIKEGITDEIALWSQGFCQENDLPANIINPALWVLSRDLCAIQLQNRTLLGNPVAIPKELKNNPSLWPASYRDPCSKCPVRKFCTIACPSSPYYRWGVLIQVIRVECPLPRTGDLPGFDVHEFETLKRRRP